MRFRTPWTRSIKGEPASFSWRVLVAGHPAKPSELRGFIDVRPVLDYTSLEAGHAATEAIRQVAAKIAPKYQATVRLTGPVAMADEEFATIKEGAVRNGMVTVVIVLFILWLALRSKRLIVAVFVNLFIGLALTAALGLADGRHAQSDLGLFCRAVRRHRRRFRHPVQRALPRRASRGRQSQGPRCSPPANMSARR